MDIPTRAALFVAVLCTPLLTQSAAGQGALAPPGPPSPTMKTLDQVEARTPISSVPFTISEPGSYYLTRNLVFTARSGHAITITAANVTLDLNGFTLSSTAEVTGNAIHAAGGIRNVTVKHGAIAGTTTVTVNAPDAVSPTWVITRGGFTAGVAVAGANTQFHHLLISGCRDDALKAEGAVVDHVSVFQNGGQGISSGLGTVTNSVARFNGSSGIDGVTVSNCYANSNQGAGIIGSAVSDCTAAYNGGRGISGSAVKNCYAVKNGDTGIMANAGSVTNSTASLNKGDGIYGIAVIGCLASENRTHGIVVAGTARDNEANSNGNGGDGAGIYFARDGVRIEGNNCAFNDWGIKGTSGTDSLIVRNSCRGNTATGAAISGSPVPENGAASGNYDFPTSNTFGPVVIANGNMSANAATSHPLVNISY